MTAADYAKARRVLARRDPVIRDLMRRYGECGLAKAQRADPFRALLHAIIAQQLSTKAAATIEARFAALFDGRPTAAAIAAVPDERLRAVGLSAAKLAYIRDLCARTLDGSVVLDALEAMPDDEVVAALTSVKGIGRWTAEMFLMFRLHRPDVLPVGDLGIRNAIKAEYGLNELPTAAEMEELAEPWRPHRTLACLYLWESISATPA